MTDHKENLAERRSSVKKNRLRIPLWKLSENKSLARWLQRQSVAARREKTIERDVEIIEMSDRGYSSYQIAKHIKVRFRKALHIKARQVQNIVKRRDAVLRYWHAMLQGIRERSYQLFLRAKRGGDRKANYAPHSDKLLDSIDRFRDNCDCAAWTNYERYSICPMCGEPSPQEQERLDRERDWEQEYRRMAFYD